VTMPRPTMKDRVGASVIIGLESRVPQPDKSEPTFLNAAVGTARVSRRVTRPRNLVPRPGSGFSGIGVLTATGHAPARRGRCRIAGAVTG